MSQSQTYAEMIDQPEATSADMPGAFYPILVPGVNGAAPLTKLANLDLIASAVAEGVIQGSLVTSGATATPFTGLPSIPSTGGYAVLKGRVVAQNQSTRVFSVWEIELAVTRTASAPNCAAFGNTTPTVFYQDSTLTGLVLTLGAGSSGPTITATGIAATAITWGFILESLTGA